MIRASWCTALSLAALTGCATVIPMQSASTLGRGELELGGQLSNGTWCGVLGDSCARMPRSVPSPEARINGRFGVGKPADVGLSLHSDRIGDDWELGGFVDAKATLFAGPEGEYPRPLVSLGLGGGLTRQWRLATEWNPGAAGSQIDVAVPLFLGLQSESFEWVVSARGLARHFYGDPLGTWVPSAGGSLGFFTRTALRFGLQLAYEAPLTMFERGTFTAGISFSHRLTL